LLPFDRDELPDFDRDVLPDFDRDELADFDRDAPPDFDRDALADFFDPLRERPPLLDLDLAPWLAISPP
jgi:hypothetical protein